MGQYYRMVHTKIKMIVFSQRHGLLFRLRFCIVFVQELKISVRLVNLSLEHELYIPPIIPL